MTRRTLDENAPVSPVASGPSDPTFAGASREGAARDGGRRSRSAPAVSGEAWPLQHVEPVEREPLELAAALARTAAFGSCMVYERAGEWGVALGAAFEIIADSKGVWRIDAAGDTCRFGSADHLVGNIEAALRSVPWMGWRAYGTAAFEFGHLLMGIEGCERQARLLELCIPRAEVRLCHGSASVRAFASDDFEQAIAIVRELDRREPESFPSSSTLLSDSYLQSTGAAAYEALVRRATLEIGLGKLQKVIASRVVPIPALVDLVATYVAGRRHNTPVRSFLVDRGTQKLAGFSPETVLEVSSDGRVCTQPLAGTRALVTDERENARLHAELLRDTKELAEHAMSVRLAFEELSRVCDPNSVGIIDFMSVCRRGSVQHLASRVAGTLASGKSAWRAFGALFPAVTASGIPKREALAWIRAHEAEPRGWYAGAVLIVDGDGAMDAALTLRSVFQHGERAWLRAGAGIVDRSTPERELRETCEKLASVARHVVTLPVGRVVRATTATDVGSRAADAVGGTRFEGV